MKVKNGMGPSWETWTKKIQFTWERQGPEEQGQKPMGKWLIRGLPLDLVLDN